MYIPRRKDKNPMTQDEVIDLAYGVQTEEKPKEKKYTVKYWAIQGEALNEICKSRQRNQRTQK